MRRDVELHRASTSTTRRRSSASSRRARPEWVFHLAAHGAYSWQTDLDRIVATNVLGTVNLARRVARRGLRGVRQRRLVVGVRLQGPRADRATSGSSPTATTPSTKAAATHFCRADRADGDGADRDAAPLLGLRAVGGARPAHADAGRARASPARCRRSSTRDVARDFVYVDDVERGLPACRGEARPRARRRLQRRQRAARRRSARCVDVARRVLAIAAEAQVGHDAGPLVGHVRRGCPTVARSAAALGWTPRYTVERGFRQMVAWMRAEPGRAEWYRSALRGSGTAKPTR